ncbi:MAG: biotin--[acetyl-CoA-carboxylase] ligase [Gammaproteobacteria bacterium]|nr:biotin--[acetyl-CoA-carboxylase] ligase [Gammaproteobacteria bacterium]MCW5583110.1 biotin--[acetyl-CoA-carboxylase] ligase [Gammaproteobacteria bacterium]
MNKKLNVNLVKVVSILNDGEYHDGTTIGKKLRMSRSAVWKIIKKLESYNIKIDSIKGKGYALLEPLLLLDVNKIKKNITNKKIDFSLFESIHSTNEYLKMFKDSRSIKICLAEQQTHGKGRMNRTWYSPFGKNIYMSCLYPFRKDVSELSGLSLVMCLAVVKTLKQSGVHDGLSVKWPNDIIYSNKKLSGSLIEIQAETHGACQAVIGIGINVNMSHDKDGQITQAWTSLQNILNTHMDRNILCINLIDNLIDYLHRFDTQGFSPFISEWMGADCLTDQVVTIKNVNQSVVGKVAGINEQGHLMLSLEDGKVRAFSSGDTSIVK